MTLIVLAATMGSKYGGLKQLEGIGPNGETILDFSVYDIIRDNACRVAENAGEKMETKYIM